MQIHLTCVDGHQYSVEVASRKPGPCPHAAGQTTLVCGGCGAGLEVVGRNDMACPACGHPMTCTKCLVAMPKEAPVNPNCRVCGKPPSRVVGAPSVSFRGDILKTVVEIE